MLFLTLYSLMVCSTKLYALSVKDSIEMQLILANFQKEVLFLSIFLLLVIAVVSYFLYVRINKRESRILYNLIMEKDLLQKELAETRQRLFALQQKDIEPEEKPVMKESNGKGLLQRLEELMRTEQLFTNPFLTRKALAERLLTNENYLATAIRNGFNGQTFSDYINSLRLEYAHHLLINNPDFSIKEITDRSGFTSYKYFHKLFHEKFGISPSKFKKMVKT